MYPFLEIEHIVADEELKILIIDDDQVDQMTIIRSLRKSSLKAQVSTSNSAKDGLDLILTNKFDCIFIDFMLPDIDGLELMRKLNEMRVQAPVIFVTSHGDERLAAQAIRLGAADYLPKSLLTPEGVYHSIRNAIRLQVAKLEKQNTEEKLRTTQHQLELIISNSPMAFWNIDQHGVFRYAKGMAYELIGINPAQLEGKTFDKILKDFPRIIARFKRALKGEVVQAVDESNGCYFKSHYAPIYDSAGQIDGVTGFAIDITDRIKNERELIAAKEVAENSVRIKERFLANISHEIRTPMNGIIGLTNVLQKTNLNQEQLKYLGAIQKSADNLMYIINDLLDFSKISAQQFTFEEVEFKLSNQLSEIIDLLSSKAGERGNSLSTFLDPKIPENILGDPLRLQQVLLNLVGNAAKFTENGAINVNVLLLEDREQDLLLEFTVQDNGIGIPADKLHTIFESFNQASNDTTRKYGGTGLGLTISKNIVEMQGGTISVRSQPGQGSTFTFSIPFRKVIKLEKPLPAKTELPKFEMNNTPVKLAGLQVLLAEDNEINQLLIRTVLSGWQVELDMVANGFEAVQQFQEKPYDLILMDMQMPEMDGYEAIEFIRSSTLDNAQIPIIALTAHASEDEVKKCLETGANAYVSKPFEADVLFQTMYKLTRASSDTAFNAESLENISGGNSVFLAEMLQMYINNIKETVGVMEEYSDKKDYHNLKQHLSELYDSIAVIEAYPLLNSLDELWQVLKQELYHEAAPLLSRINRESNALVNLLEREYDKIDT